MYPMTLSWLQWAMLGAFAVFTGGGAAASPSALAPGPVRFAFQVMEDGGAGPAAGDAFMDIGRVSAVASQARSKAIVVTRRIAVRLEGLAPAARVSVALLAEMPGCTVRLDGVTLSPTPRVVDSAQRIGSTVVHRLEISIPASVPAGPLLSSLQWLAETD
jgi:hypothetical protein